MSATPCPYSHPDSCRPTHVHISVTELQPSFEPPKVCITFFFLSATFASKMDGQHLFHLDRSESRLPAKELLIFEAIAFGSHIVNSMRQWLAKNSPTRNDIFMHRSQFCFPVMMMVDLFCLSDCILS